MVSEMKSPLTVQGLCKYYPAFRLEDVSFRLVPGSITGFIGRNGAGKTTTINSMLSFVHPDAGEISFFGLDYPEHDREIKEKIGFVSAGMTYYTRKKLKTITGVVKTFYPDWDDKAYERWMKNFGLYFSSSVRKHSKPRCESESRSLSPRAGACVSRMSKPPLRLSASDRRRIRRFI